MSGPTIADLIRNLTGRRSAVQLLRHLGFREAPRPDASPHELPAAVHALLATGEEILRACLIELRAPLDVALVRDVARVVRTRDPITFHFFLVAERGYTRFALACDGPDRGLRHVCLERDALRASDLDIIAEMVPRPGEAATARALRFSRALDRSRVTQRFFRDVVGMRDLVARAWTGIPRDDAPARDALALLLLSRLLFLYFLQRRGQLAGDLEFLPNLLRQTRDRRGASFFRSSLRTLFFGVLNRRPGKRVAAARALGELPYLNGGLFEEHRLELRHPRLDIPDAALARVFTGLLDKYRFTTVESTSLNGAGDEHVGIDPEMLGRIFEGLMPGEQRGRTGTFYTPPAIVSRVATDAIAEHLAAHCNVPVTDVLDLLEQRASCDVARHTPLMRALESVRVLDPACGSGAFLMGALTLITQLRVAFGADPVETRRDVVARTLHGVDLLDDAALICSLRLWLSLIPAGHTASIPPLPNLDRRIRQGDALIDPLDLHGVASGHPFDVPPSSELREVLARLAPAAAQYLRAEPEEKSALRRELNELERKLARIWTRTLVERLVRLEKELIARAGDRDLFGDAVAHATAATRRLSGVAAARAELQTVAAEMAHSRALPFFSFRVHFAEAARGFDLVLSNPPWVRAHRWPPAMRRILRERYRVCADAGWPDAARMSRQSAGAGAQVDLSLLFLERSIELLAAGGTLGMLLPAKLFRSLYAGGARALARAQLQPLSIEDHALDHRAIFDADAFTAVLIARRRAESSPPGEVRVTLTRSGCAPLRFTLNAEELPLRAGDDRAPWLLAPPACSAAFRQMQRCPALGDDEGLSIHRGVMTGCNEVLVLRQVEPKLGDIAAFRAEGHGAQAKGTSRGFSGHIEASVLRPALRGTDVCPWRIDVRRHVIWVPANDDPAQPPPPRTRRYLLKHSRRLCGERPARTAELGVLHRLGEHTLGDKVVWSDVARNLRAAAVPAHMRAVTGEMRPIVPLNTVYFVRTTSYREALLLAAYFNSTPVRTFARAIAERAKDAHFRFFAWTVAVLPVPRDWRSGEGGERLLELSQRAHDQGTITEADQMALDDIVCAAYGLSHDQRAAIHELDAWFNGPGVERT